MPSKREKALPLFINDRKWVGSLFTSGLTFNFTQVKVKKAGMPHRVNLHLKKNILTQKCYCEISIIIAIN